MREQGLSMAAGLTYQPYLYPALRTSSALQLSFDYVPHTVTQCNWMQVSAGDSHTCGLGVDSKLTCWGLDKLGQVSGIPGGAECTVLAKTMRWPQKRCVSSGKKRWLQVNSG